MANLSPPEDQVRLGDCIMFACEGPELPAEGCGDLRASLVGHVERTAGMMAEDTAAPLLHARGWSQYSQRDLVLSALRDGVPEALGLGDCEFISRVLEDTVHPQEGPGHFLVADFLVRLPSRSFSLYLTLSSLPSRLTLRDACYSTVVETFKYGVSYALAAIGVSLRWTISRGRWRRSTGTRRGSPPRRAARGGGGRRGR